MSTDFRTALEQWRDLADTDLLCPENPAETDWGAVVVAIAATRVALSQPEGQGSLNVNLSIDTSPENLKRLCDGLAAAVTPNGGYDAATTDDPAPGTGGDQVVQVEWWIPQHGCDSLENTLDAIKYRIGRAVTDWWATALVPANQPNGDSPTDDDLLQFAVQRLGLLRAPNAETLLTLEAGELFGLLRAVLTRWGRPATLEHLGGSITDEQREAVRAAVAEALGDTYDCTRAWEAWQVGTIGLDDFVLVSEDGDRVAEIADAAIEALRPAAMAAPELCSLTMKQVMDLEMLEPSDLYSGEPGSFCPAGPPPLPPNYIDPEHQGEDRELLQTFYRACQAEGGTVDEICLRGIRAVLAARPAAPSAPEAGQVAELVAWIEQYRNPMHLLHDSDDIAHLTRAATLLQHQQARIADLRSALADCGRAVGASISDDCSDGFLLEVPGEVRLAVAKIAQPAPPPTHDLSNAAPLLWLLWHHLDSYSPVGQPIRNYLGMGQFEGLSDAQIAAAKQYRALSLERIFTAGADYLEEDFRAWYEESYGCTYYGVMALCDAIRWVQHLLQRQAASAAPPATPPAPEAGEVET